ncbi:flagellar export chaperone FliS [Oxalobacteraceae bacterium OM1]|nr:flagellar export chaperone FliS [Oxalobacteraceae bacterium OM1]
MFGSMNGARAYANVGIETGVAAASPHALVVMLFDGAIAAVNGAKQAMQARDIAAKGKSVSKAISIIEEGLRASLDRKVGGEIALNLDALYEYMNGRLVNANATNDPAALDEVLQLLKGLKDAWVAIKPADAAVATPVQPAPAQAAYDPLAARAPVSLVKA